jgi:hypothetical protein
MITDKIKADLDDLANKEKVPVEGLTCVLLRLALSDDSLVQRALKLMEKCDLSMELQSWKRGAGKLSFIDK